MERSRQKVIVIGGSSGIGLATALRLSLAGAEVVATGRDLAKLRAATAGHAIEIAAFDARERSALEQFFDRMGPIDHLILALSGGQGAGLLAELDLQSLRAGFEEKFWPQIQAAQAGAAHLRAGGSITFITAISARIARPGTAGLGAINGAIEAMIGSLARELKPSRVNAVSPGVVDTPWWDRFPASFRDDLFREQREILPVGRVGHADEVAHAVQFLVENGYVTGTVIACDGGLHLV
ncbi:SDR family oxidoreductase [Labrys portucalensis]|uniref:SDR family oxidoreductase n=1 Tax=Labrys neptuniae TaxID=376174 RepID=A0ABV3PF86_9HYPH|nr:SDR family oxidoreductase [Labrys neptuniae]MDT3379174.1 SDR family oxidoreductase [Labrys neptuniae]